jgi:hypothetical protein
VCRSGCRIRYYNNVVLLNVLGILATADVRREGSQEYKALRIPIIGANK